MNESLKEFFESYLTCVISYVWFKVTYNLINDVRKLFIFSKLFKKKALHSIDNLKTDTHSYVVLEGEAEKINKSLSHSAKNIILSESYSTYYEDFLLTIDNANKNVLIQPYQRTKLLNIKKSSLEKGGLIYRMYRYIFFKEPRIIQDKDTLFIFGKINSNSNIVDSFKFSDIIHIKPKVICGGTYNQLVAQIKTRQVSKCLNSFILCVLFSFVIGYKFKNSIWPKIKSLTTRNKVKPVIYCCVCNVQPCNILCKRCDNTTVYCDICFNKLQERIDEGEINFENIKCHFCTNILEEVIKSETI